MKGAISRHPRTGMAAVFILTALAAYSNSFHVPFMRDDIASIERNPSITRLGDWRQVLNPPGQGNTVYARPVLNVSFAVNRAIHGLYLPAWHASNLAIHILNALLLFGLVQRLHARGSTVPATGFPWPAFFIAWLWLLHPLQTESVTYLVQRAESLAGTFYLLTLYALVRTADPAAAAPHRWAFAAVAAAALGMATKEILITAPLLALILDRTFFSPSWRTLWRARGRLHLALLATMSVQGFLLAHFGRMAHDAALTAGRSTPLEYLWTQAGVITHYLRLAVWPRGLCFDLFDWPIAPSLTAVWPQVAGIAALALATLALLWKHARLAFPGVCFFLLLAPTSSIMPIEDVAVEHRMYLPLAAVLTVLVLGVHRLAAPRGARLRCATGILGGVLALGLGLLAWQRNHDYRSDLSIAEDTLAKRPASARAAYDMAIALLSRDRPAEALPYFETAIAGKADYAMAVFGRGEARRRLGRFAEALADFDRAYALNPLYFFIPNNMGMLRLDQGDMDGAIADFSVVIAKAPGYGPAWYNRGRAHLQAGDTAAALRDFSAALDRAETGPEAWVARGNLLAALGRFNEAEADFNQAIDRGGQGPEIFYNRANVRARREDWAGALHDFNAAITLNPAFGEALNNRASVNYLVGRTREAAADLAACRRHGFIPNPELERLIAEALADDANAY